MRKLRRVWNSMQVSPKIVAVMKTSKPLKFENVRIIIVRKIKIIEDIFV